MLESNLTSTPILFGEIQREILDVRKEEQDKVVEPTLDDIVVKPDSAMQTLGSVLVKGVTANIDENIKPENIKLGTTILGVQGNVAPDKPDQEKTIYPSEEEQVVVADNGFELAKVIAKPIETESFDITPSTSEQVVKASDGKFIKEVKVGAIEDIDEEVTIQEEKLETLMGKVEDLPIDLPSQDKVITPSNEQQTIVADEGFKLGSVVVEPQESYQEDLLEQRASIDDLEADVNALSDKPTDMLQQMVDQTNSCYRLFYSYGGTNLDFIGGLDTSNVTDMTSMFDYCSALTSVDVSKFDMSNVRSTSHMFNNCKALLSLDTSNWNKNSITSMYRMFYECNNLVSLDLSKFDTSHTNNMSGMFYNCYDLVTVDVSNFNTSLVTDMSSMFSNCNKLESLDVSNFNTSNVTDMTGMFGCGLITSLDVSGFDTSKVTTMEMMFRGCYALPSLDVSSFDTSKVKSMRYAFSSLRSLETLDLSSFDTRNVTNMEGMFNGSSGLNTIIGKINIINATNVSSMFSNCTNLTNVTLFNIKKSLSLGSGTSWGTKVSNDTLINTIQQLWNLTGQTSQKLTLSTASKNNIANIYVKLVDVTDEMLAEDENIANKKPCVVCESTDAGAMTLTEYATSKNWAIA